MAFDTQITDLVGGTIDQVACDQWAADACKEIIHVLPAKLKAKCATISIINATNGTTLDLDGIGDILSITRLSANSGGYYKPCREIPAMYGDLANDSTDLNYYATASDPVYYITSNTSDAVTLFVKPKHMANNSIRNMHCFPKGYGFFDMDTKVMFSSGLCSMNIRSLLHLVDYEYDLKLNNFYSYNTNVIDLFSFSRGKPFRKFCI